MCETDNHCIRRAELLRRELGGPSSFEQKQARIEERGPFLRLRDGAVALGWLESGVLNQYPRKASAFSGAVI